MKNIKKSLLTLVFGASAAAVLLTSCAEKNFTIEFDVDGGVTIENASVKEGEGFTLPNPTKDGYSFEGWFTSEDLSGSPIVTVDSMSGDIKVYAKWEKLYSVTINLNGGTLANSKLELKAGEDVYAALQALTPTKAGVTFAGWYVNGEKLTTKLAMTTAGVTVDAKYSQTVTNEYYVQNLEGEFEKVTETDTAIVGDTYTASKTQTGYSLVTKEDSTPSITVSENANSNVTKTYYERNSYTVTYNVSYPDGSESNQDVDKVVYGSTYNLFYDYYCDGAILLGWATEEDGEIVYPVDSYRMYVANKEYEHENTSVEIAGDLTLYPVWEKAYTNMFAGEDYVYFLDGKVYLERGGVLFEGTILDEEEFYFKNVNDEIFLQGKRNTDGTFSWASDVRAAKSYNLFVSGQGLDSLTTIYFDNYNGCKYEVKNAETNLANVSNGSYSINEDGTFTATFVDGDMADKTITFKVGTVSGKNAFQIRDEEQYGLGELPIFVVNETIIDVNPNYTFTFTGFGGCKVGSYNYYVTYNEETGVYALVDTSDTSKVSVYVKLVEQNGEVGVAVYSSSLDHTYTSNDDTLTLDGTFNATLTLDGTEVTGLYTTSTSALGKTMVTVIDDNGLSYLFTISSETSEDTTVYSFTALDADYYAELYYSTGESAYYAPLVVIESATNASVYSYDTTTKKYTLALTGTYAKNANGRFAFTALTYEAETAESRICDLITLASFEFGVTTFTSSSSTLKVQFWYSYTTKGETGAKVDLTKTYTYKENDAMTITLVENYVILSVNGNSAIYTYTQGDGYITMSMNGSKYNLALDDETMLFDDYQSSNQNERSIQVQEYVSGNVNSKSYINVVVTVEGEEYKYTYYYVSEDAEGNEVSIEGTVEETEETSLTGFPVQKFTSKDGTLSFKFIQLSASSKYYFTREVAGTKKTFTDSYGDTIELDGFGFACVVTIDGEEETYLYVYEVSEDGKTAVLTIQNEDTYILDVDVENLTFDERGEEIGTYVLMKNQAFNNYIELDGHGNAVIFKYDNNEKVTITEAEYMALDDFIYIFYDEGEEKIFLIGLFSTYTYNNTTINTIILSNEDYADYFINFEDYSVLEIDEFNTATLYDKYGEVIEGDVTFISNNLVYFVSTESETATIFEIDYENGTMAAADYKLKGYYTTDFESLIFYQYGFVLENGGNRAFYYMNEYDEVTLYKYDSENEAANEFGYVAYNFGEFDPEIEYNGKKYYINTGYSIEFKRAEDSKTLYPLLSSSSETVYSITSLYFAPTGLEFTVSGQATITGTDDSTQNITVTVTREKLENGSYVLYATYGSYRFDLTAEYKGVKEDGTSASSFAITGMSQTITYKSYSFAYMCYMYYSYFGQDVSSTLTDSVGGVALKIVYGEDGKIASDKLVSSFTDKSCALDSNGKVLVFDTADYTISGSLSQAKIKASTKGSDDYTYTLYAQGYYFEQFGFYFVSVAYIVRDQKFTTTEGYEVTISQYTAVSDSCEVAEGESVGVISGVTIKIGDVEYVTNDGWNDAETEGLLHVTSRTFDENGKLVSTKFFKILVTYETNETKLATLIKSVTVTEETDFVTFEFADGSGYIQVIGNTLLMFDSESGSSYTLYSKDTTTNTYVLKYTSSSDGKDYTVTISLDENGKAVIGDPVEVVAPTDDSTDGE